MKYKRLQFLHIFTYTEMKCILMCLYITLSYHSLPDETHYILIKQKKFKKKCA